MILLPGVHVALKRRCTYGYYSEALRSGVHVDFEKFVHVDYVFAVHRLKHIIVCNQLINAWSPPPRRQIRSVDLERLMTLKLLDQ